MTTQPKRKRAPGGGRKPKPPGEKRVKTAITMRPDHYDATAGDRSGMIERALDAMLTTKSSNQPQGANNKTMRIIFWERTIGAKFPDFNAEIDVPETETNLIAAAGGTFTVEDMEISFSESVHDNGWWAKKPGQPGRCRVTIEM